MPRRPHEFDTGTPYDHRDDDLGGLAPMGDDPYVVKVDRKGTIKELDLQEELLNIYYDAQDLLLMNRTAPLNQKVQNMNAVNGILKEIIKSQEIVHSIERVKIIENCIIETLKLFPTLKAEFFDRYERALVQLAEQQEGTPQ